jgi:violaxanthin de-epoxidase
VGKCLLANCPKELAQCIADPSCVQNLLCLQTCNGKDRDEESRCQVTAGTVGSRDRASTCSAGRWSHPWAAN